MRRLEKDTEFVIPRPHSFPALHSTSENAPRQDDRFRPLFHTPAGISNTENDSPPDGMKGGDDSNPLADALKESYERGIEEGRKDACSLAQQELEPSLQGFFNRLNAFKDHFGQFTHNQAVHIIALAFSIACKISGRRTLPEDDALLSVQEELDAGLRRHHQLELQFNKNDLKELADLMHCRSTDIDDSGVVRICDVDDIQRGAPRLGPSAEAFEELIAQITQALEDLS